MTDSDTEDYFLHEVLQADEPPPPETQFMRAGDAVVEDVWTMHFGDLGPVLKTLFLGGRPFASEKVKAALVEQWRKDDFAYVIQGVRSLPQVVGEVSFNTEDFLTRVKRLRGTLTRSTEGYVVFDSKWTDSLANQLCKLYTTSTRLEIERVVNRFSDALTGSRNSYQVKYRDTRKTRSQEVADKAKADETTRRRQRDEELQADEDQREAAVRAHRQRLDADLLRHNAFMEQQQAGPCRTFGEFLMNLQRQAQESERGRLDLTAALYKDNASLVGELRKAATVRAPSGIPFKSTVARPAERPPNEP
jgi:hypothetical protein